MMEAILDRLQRISLDVLTDVVRQDQRRSSLIITDWAVQPLSDKGIINPGGLWALDGHARAAHGTCMCVVTGDQGPATPSTRAIAEQPLVLEARG